jgi:hypothetical protein
MLDYGAATPRVRFQDFWYLNGPAARHALVDSLTVTIVADTGDVALAAGSVVRL